MKHTEVGDSLSAFWSSTCTAGASAHGRRRPEAKSARSYRRWPLPWALRALSRANARLRGHFGPALA